MGICTQGCCQGKTITLQSDYFTTEKSQ
ncbi:hypothetical protein LINGRAHAP2_LOCUS4615 [Linum grandiflorum]